MVKSPLWSYLQRGFRLHKVLFAFATAILCGGTPHQTYVEHKAVHAVAGTTVAWAGHELGYPKTGIALAWSLGIAKELYDKKHGGSFRAGDVAWTGAPATVISISFKW